MRRRMFLILALIIFVVAGVIYIVFQFGGSGLGGGAKTPTPEVSTYNVVFVAQDIPAGTEITNDSVIVGPWPRDLPLPGLMTDVAAVVGKRARIDLRRGEPVFSSQVVESGTLVSDKASSTALKIKPGKVAIAVPMSRLSGVAYAIGNGDHIMIIASLLYINLDAGFQTDTPNNMLLVGLDAEGKVTFLQVQGGRIFKESPLSDVLLATYYTPIEAQRPRLASAILVSDARVLNVGTVNTPAVAITTPVPGEPQTAPIAAAIPDILVIEVTPQEALAISFIIRLRADLTYALRSAGDTTAISVPSMDLKRLMDDFKIDLPPNLSYGTVPRIDLPYLPVLGNDVPVEVR
jgi:Flp pilus assembly protein CpaB